ncbi:synaptonemal complex protein 2 [Cricetulus griseus]|uniref:Synaptonemal complex protein 2 n=1 Tax=Cricetulus griseus TaxID=10029 RepID=A0A9J7JQP4_CRIGR|nr:synaptonemal complex protein 2 [Cricetulus griseus]XP_035293119.1 synaptonemal complex protein 2 [Cricetulus griseus]
MPVKPDFQQLEKCIDDALRKNDFKPLMILLQIDIYEDVKIKCSKQFLHKLDDLICRELNKKDIQTISNILICVGRCSKNILILGQAGLLTMIKQGLVQKMVSWFEKSKEVIVSQGQSKDEAVMNMVEDLFDLLMVVYDINDEGKKQVLECFIPHICALVIDPRVNICIQQEALKKMNLMLDRIPQDANKILSNQEILTLMSDMGERILDVGDYELQVGIVEALCRMTTEKRRRELACQWFSMDFIANAFKGIKDCEFETDCRIFLNLVNGMLGDKRRVFTFPCLSAFLDKYELQIPSDEKLEEFWIDFNLGSQTLSFYIAGDDEDHQWEAVTVPEEKVQMYNIEVIESKKLLTITLKNIVKISKKEGKELLLYFDASLEITNVTKKIFGGNKYKEFTRKQGISVAKTSIHILFDASGSQILVPESQPSLVKEDLVHLKETSNLQKKHANPPKQGNSSNQEDRTSSQDEITTPSRKKMSEASMIVPDADRYTVRSPILLVNTSTPRRSRAPLQAINPAPKADGSKTSKSRMDYAVSLKSRQSNGRNIWNNRDKNKTTNVVKNKENEHNESPDQNFNEIDDTFSDVCAMEKVDEPSLSGIIDVSKNKAHSKWACWTPVTTIKLCNNQRDRALPGHTFAQDTGVNKKCTKQKSVSDDDSEETQRAKHRKDVKYNKSDEEVCERNKQEQNHSKYLQKKNTENAKQSDWHIESETTYKSVLLNKTTEESLIYKKTCVLSKDVNTTVCDKSPSRKCMSNCTKSRKELTSELNSCALKEIPLKEKSKGKGFTGAAESLISQINKRYNSSNSMKSTRKLKETVNGSGFSKKSDLQFSKVQRKSYRKLKTTFVNVTSECPLNDVYNFSLNGTDEPVIKLGIQEFQATTREASMDNSIKLTGVRNHDEHDPSFKTKNKRMSTSHENTLFSDAETECDYDDSKTDISWLRKPKSKRLMDYSRNRNMKTYKSGKPRSSIENGQPRSIMVPNKNITKNDDEIVADVRTRLPRRATKTKKNYKDLSTSESESESEKVSYLFKDKLPTKEETVHSRAPTKKLPKKQQNIFTTETPKGQPSENQEVSSELKDGREDSLSLSSASVSGSPSSVEVMRCMEKITERDFTQDYDYITKSLSPYPKTASPESVRGNNKVKVQEKSPRISEISTLCVRKSFSPVIGLPSLPRNTPTKNNSVMNRKNKNSVIDNQKTLHYNSYSDVSSNSSEKRFMETESPDSHENHMQSKREASHAVSPLSLSSEIIEKIWLDMPSDNTHVSGPSLRSRKRQMYLEDDDLSNSNDAEVEEAEERDQLLSKRLCQRESSDHHTYKDSLSTPDFSIPEDWRQELPGVGMFFDNISSDYKRKTNTQHKIMDDFATKTLKLTQQHLMTMTHQARGRRDENFDKFQVTLLDELEKVEKDSQTLRDLEKEIADIEEKFVQKMRAYHRSEQDRLHVLKTSLDKNFVVYNSVYEETIFTSEMRLMKANMKVLQDKLLKEMHEEELLNVRRGLSSLFKVHEGNDV